MTEEASTFEQILAHTVPQSSEFYRRIVRAQKVLTQVREQSNGHGITLVLRRDEEPSVVNRWMKNAKPYNGIPHNINDPNIVDVMSDPKKREKDLATVVDSLDTIVGANVPLPMCVEDYQDKYGIKVPMWQFLGYAAHEEAPGGRMNSAICATDRAGEDIFILTLGENKPDGSKGTINGYFCGDRIYSESDRKMRWDLAKRRPAHYANVVPFPEQTPEHYCGPERYQERPLAASPL